MKIAGISGISLIYIFFCRDCIVTLVGFKLADSAARPYACLYRSLRIRTLLPAYREEFTLPGLM